MKPNNIISTWLKTLACLAFAFALVLSPPTASHAASGMQGDQHAVSVSSDNCDVSYVHDAGSSNSKYEKNATISDMGAKDQKSGPCGSDICLSAVLNQSGHNFVVQVTSSEYLMLHAQPASAEPSGFLRPPQFLI